MTDWRVLDVRMNINDCMMYAKACWAEEVLSKAEGTKDLDLNTGDVLFLYIVLVNC